MLATSGGGVAGGARDPERRRTRPRHGLSPLGVLDQGVGGMERRVKGVWCMVYGGATIAAAPTPTLKALLGPVRE